MKNIKISDLRHRLALQKPELTPDTGGGSSISWVTIADIWAFIKPLSGSEKFQSHQTQTIITHKIIIRHRTGVLPEMRLLKDNRVFEIVAVINEMELKRWLQLECIEQAL